MKIMLTGGAGFIGSHIADLLIEEGHQIIIIDNLSTGKESNINPSASFYQLDVLDESLEDIFVREKPEIVNHHAAQINVRESVANPIQDLEINIRGSVRLFELSRKYGVKKVVFASSGGAIYGEQSHFPADEDHPLKPLSPYGVSKLAGENYLYYYEQNFGLPSVSLRYANVCGPRQDPFGEAGVVAIFAQKMLTGQQLIINGSGEQTRDYVCVEDVARINLMVLKDKVTGQFNVGTGKETTVNYLFQKIKSLTHSGVREVHGEPKKGEQLRSVLSAEKAKRVLGWEPLIGLDEGLEKTVNFFKSTSRKVG
ncbi:MAG: NAD-dependent epimerase/dehydratase family protein [Deltaproteobacteria bacterium]|nr:NAD-dependent epimerase/dehydratase family protein [Deltaproteobacteria bacterium]